MSAEETMKKGRGAPPYITKPDAWRAAIKVRWTEEEIETVKAAASAVEGQITAFELTAGRAVS